MEPVIPPPGQRRSADGVAQSHSRLAGRSVRHTGQRGLIRLLDGGQSGRVLRRHHAPGCRSHGGVRIGTGTSRLVRGRWEPADIGRRRRVAGIVHSLVHDGQRMPVGQAVRDLVRQQGPLRDSIRGSRRPHRAGQQRRDS